MSKEQYNKIISNVQDTLDKMILDKISEYLLEKETIFGDEFFRFVYEKYPELKAKREEEKKSKELENNKKDSNEIAVEVNEDLLDKKVAQEVIEAVEKEEENITQESSADVEIILDIDKEVSNNDNESKDK